MASTYPHLTLDQLYDNYQFKVVKKALMREYPWIKNVTVDEEELNKYGLIFLNLDIDPAMVGEQQGWTMTPWVKNAYRDGMNYHGMYLSLFYDQLNYDDVKEVQDDINLLANSVGQSPAFPKDLLLQGGRTFGIGEVHVNQGGPAWFG
jgi:hypothetical protein